MFKVESVRDSCWKGPIMLSPRERFQHAEEGRLETFNEAKKCLAGVVAKAIKEEDDSLHCVCIYDEAGAMGHGPGALVYNWMKGWWPKGYGFV